MKGKIMTKSELISRVAAQQPQMKKTDVEAVVDAIFQQMTRALSERQDRVEIRGFGTFNVKQRNAREGRNPRTGETIQIPARKAIHFRAGKELNSNINQDGP